MTHGARRRPGVPGDDLGTPTDPKARPDAGSVGSHRFGRAVHVGDANACPGSVWSFRSRGGYVVSPGRVPLPAAILAPHGTFTFGHTLIGTTAARARLGWGFAN
ncbi:hypothetical protein OG426_19660 [Streptomyces canus]|uniref:hypothetical protein n=1 Tax=Streptomyces canus TaxID=58343 RepID=UPI00386C6F69|nr:hypothetical protein OG426_19660 [Streptomyces canus]